MHLTYFKSSTFSIIKPETNASYRAVRSFNLLEADDDDDDGDDDDDDIFITKKLPYISLLR